MAFITSQGVMNSPSNEMVRHYLMEHTNLISAIRLPNNLFADYAGTEVGSDLIVLQKNSNKEGVLTQQERAFIATQKQSDGTTDNQYMLQTANIVYTQAKVSTDPYGKPATVYLHEGGVEGIATDLKVLLAADLHQHLDPKLYERAEVINKQEENPPLVIEAEQWIEPLNQKNESQAIEQLPFVEPVLSLYDLFGMSQEERSQITPKKGKSKKTSGKSSAQRSLFDSTQVSTPVSESKPSPSVATDPIADAREEQRLRNAVRLKEQEEEHEQALAPRPYDGQLCWLLWEILIISVHR